MGKNATLNFFVGISYERLVIYHNASATIAVILGFFHVYVAFMYGESMHDTEDLSQYSSYGGEPDLIKFAKDIHLGIPFHYILISTTGTIRKITYQSFRRL